MKNLLLSTLLLLLAMPALAQKPSADVEIVWSLEEAYWKDVKANDLEHYRALWHPNFLGWPSISPVPLRKAQITKWITDHTGKGESLKSYELDRLILQQTNDLVTTTYRVRLVWADKNGAGNPQTTRIIHTWIKGPNGQWEIISGMSAPANAEGF